jgi:glutathione synthase/RimK-type ligase-like ATP-grasp enzyme
MVTAAAFVEVDRDLASLPSALAKVGIECSVVSWDDASVDWAAFDGAVIRSTWDYIDRLDEFLAWTEAVEARTRLANPSAVVRWNCSKRYLVELAAAGVGTVPTWWASEGLEIPPEWLDVVVKPAVSAGGRSTGRFRDRDAARSFVRELVGRGEDVLVQPYLPSVDDHGEIAVFFFGGIPSHAVRKGGILSAVNAPATDYALAFGQRVEPVPLSRAPTEFARSVLDAVPKVSRLLYARVDCVQDGAGREMVLEVELVAPSLVLDLNDGASHRFASAIASWLKDARDGASLERIGREATETALTTGRSSLRGSDDVSEGAD